MQAGFCGVQQVRTLPWDLWALGVMAGVGAQGQTWEGLQKAVPHRGGR
jgi:hypothetical protein